MDEKRFKILLALSQLTFQKRAAEVLGKYYSVQTVKNVKEFSDAVHKGEFDLIIIDYRFSGMKAEDVYQGVEMMHPNAVFVVYTEREKKAITKKLWKRRAIDYINHTNNMRHFVLSVNKVMRWTIQKRDTLQLEKTLRSIESLISEVKVIVKRWK